MPVILFMGEAKGEKKGRRGATFGLRRGKGVRPIYCPRWGGEGEGRGKNLASSMKGTACRGSASSTVGGEPLTRQVKRIPFRCST